MNLYPNDLGKRVNWEVQQDRTQTPEAAGSGIQPNTLGGWALVCFVLFGLFGVLHVLALMIVMGAGTLFYAGRYAYLSLKSLNAAESLQSPVTDYEIQAVRTKVGDVLLRNYLDLALSVLNLPPTKDEAADREVRDAITALGVALEALPPEQPVVTDDPAALRAEAQAQLEAAQAEPDFVIAASRRRRAESLLRRADTSARTLLLLRRNKALREEVGEQIQALGTSLTALQVGGRQSTPELSGLAASIHRVALEANAVTVARAEVDTLLSQPVQGREEAQAIRVSL